MGVGAERGPGAERGVITIPEAGVSDVRLAPAEALSTNEPIERGVGSLGSISKPARGVAGPCVDAKDLPNNGPIERGVGSGVESSVASDVRWSDGTTERTLAGLTGLADAGATIGSSRAGGEPDDGVGEDAIPERLDTGGKRPDRGVGGASTDEIAWCGFA
jgi:hypothetical protein